MKGKRLVPGMLVLALYMYCRMEYQFDPNGTLGLFVGFFLGYLWNKSD